MCIRDSIDTGVNYNHADLDGGRVRTDIDHDFINDDDDAMDDQGHGTFVAGIIAADTNDGVGIAGVCANCRILPVKVLDGEGSGSAESVAQGIQLSLIHIWPNTPERGAACTNGIGEPIG